MNYLAHLYLSGTSHQLMVGNFIGDAVKGKVFEAYPDEIKEGILLHRRIDTYTDNHTLVKHAKSYFKNSYDKYSGVAVDMLFDHFLASNWNDYHQYPLPKYVDHVNHILLSHFEHMPPRIQFMMPFWVKHRWPELYRTKTGLYRVLNGMTHYTSMPQKVAVFKESLMNNYTELKGLFDIFFEEVSEHFLIRS
jgi:acyl carrier protein phosphodiesterase